MKSDEELVMRHENDNDCKDEIDARDSHQQKYFAGRSSWGFADADCTVMLID
jgi:hypothetical protein